MENDILDTTVNSSLHVDNLMKEHLRTAAKWSKFLAILTFIMVGFIVIAVISLIAFGSSMKELTGGVGTVAIAAIYLVFGAIYLIPALAKFKFSTSVKTALATDSQQDLAESFRNMKNVFQFYGILAAVVLALYAILFLVVGVAGVSAIF